MIQWLTERDVTLVLPKVKFKGMVILADFESRADGRITWFVLASSKNGR